MIFEPCNRYLLIERGVKPEEESLIALPDNFQKKEKHERVKVLAASSDVRSYFHAVSEIVVLAHMIEEVDFGEGKVYLVLENHVVGVLKE